MAEQISQSLHNREAEPEAAEVGAVLDLIILIEDTRQVLFGNADAAVPHLDAHLFAKAAATEQNPASLGVTQRVGQKVAQHHLEHAPVAMHHELRSNHAKLKAAFRHRFEKLGFE